MQTNKFLKCFALLLLFSFAFFSHLYAEEAFDFGLPLFGLEEIRFETSKTPDLNFQLLKKYLNEHPGSLYHLHAITRWFSLIKLSDPKHRAELIEISSKFFSTANKKEITDVERLNEIFFRGLLLANDKISKDDNSADEKFEELLLANETPLANSPDYSLIKGILFHYLRHRPNDYFAVMKPEEDLKKALLKIPQTPHYYYVLGQAFRLLGNQESSLFLAIASYEKSASLDPHNLRLQNSLLGIYMSLHEYYQSNNKPEPFWLEEAVYKKILTLSPNNPYALNNLGYLYAEYGVNIDIAQRLCQKAVNLNPNDPGFRDSLGWAAFKNKNYQKAEEELKKSLSIRNNIYEPHYHLATLYYATKQFDLAEKYYRTALQLKPDAAEALNNLAYLLAQQNQKIEEATAMANTAVKLEPHNASYLDTLGWLYYRAGNLDQALNMLLKSAQLAPDQAEILMHIGVVYLDKGEFSKSLDYLKQAHKLDPNLKETEAAIYLALRLKGHFTALSEYHSIYGKSLDRDRICQILTDIARIYQEEKQYEKAIEYTKICADVRNRHIDLNKPLFAFYSLPEVKENPKIENTNKTTTTNKYDSFEQQKIPENLGFPIVISLGPDFFKYASKFCPTLDQFKKTSLTFFIRHFFKPGYELTIRLESENSTGTSMLKLATDFFRELNCKIQEGELADSYLISFRDTTLILIAERNSLYFTTVPIPDEKTLEKLAAICPHYSDTLATIYFDWQVIESRLPSFIKPFVKNPMDPFIRSVSRYTYKDSRFSEFSVMTTGKEENSQFMRNLARRLLAFKMQAKALDIEATIKLRGEKDLVYLLVDIEGFPNYLDKIFSPLIRRLIRKLIDIVLRKSRCFISRMFYYPSAKKVCPANGKISVDAFSGLVHCDRHYELPALPFFIDEAAACSYRRQRLEKIINELPESAKKGKKNEDLLNELTKKYNLLKCPTGGTFFLDQNGKLNCSDHK